VKKKAKKGKTVLPDSSSASESPMKQVVFDLTFSSDEDEVIELRAKTPPPADNSDTEDEDSEGSRF